MKRLARAIAERDYEFASYLADLILDERFPGRWK
jgi:hypothetical protein